MGFGASGSRSVGCGVSHRGKDEHDVSRIVCELGDQVHSYKGRDPDDAVDRSQRQGVWLTTGTAVSGALDTIDCATARRSQLGAIAAPRRAASEMADGRKHFAHRSDASVLHRYRAFG